MNTRGLNRIERKLQNNTDQSNQIHMALESIQAIREKRHFNYPVPFANRITFVDLIKKFKKNSS
jgi:hypothetical protein